MLYLLLGLGVIGIVLSLLLPLIPEYLLKKDKDIPREKKESLKNEFELKVNKLLLNLTEEEQKEITYVKTQQALNNKVKLPTKIRFKLYMAKLFNNPYASMSLVTVVIQIIVMIFIASFLATTLLLPLLFIPFFILLSSAPLSNYMYKTQKNELSVMESNFFLCTSHYNKYLSSSTFIDSLKVTRNQFLPGSREYSILTKVYDAMTINNMPMEVAVRYWGDLMLGDTTIRHYLQTILKCEFLLPEYKHSMPLILERSKTLRFIKAKQLDNYMYFLQLSNFSVIVSIGILYYLRYFNTDENTVRMFTTVSGFTMTFMVFLLEALCIWIVLIINKPLKFDMTGYDELIKKRVRGE